MVQTAISSILKEALGGITDNFPKPPVSGGVTLHLTLEVKDGELVPKEGSEVQIDVHLDLGGDD